MGDEEKGLGTDTRKLCDTLFKIPMVSGGVGSLNVSVAAGVALYEIVRQR
jgi:23S rRNA (guanosine2251-2'-O)-methyltransferase